MVAAVVPLKQATEIMVGPAVVLALAVVEHQRLHQPDALPAMVIQVVLDQHHQVGLVVVVVRVPLVGMLLVQDHLETVVLDAHGTLL